MLAVLVTDPVGPVDPWVVTVSGPEVKKVAGPTLPNPDGAVAVCGLFDPSAAKVTVGVGPVMMGGPPNRPTDRKKPRRSVSPRCWSGPCKPCRKE